MNLNELKKIILNEVVAVLREHDNNNVVVNDFTNNFMKLKRLVQQYENIADPSSQKDRINELKIDLSNMFIRSLDQQTQTKYKNINPANLIKLADAIINFYHKNNKR